MRRRILTFVISFVIAVTLHAGWLQLAARELYRRGIPGFDAGPLSLGILLVMMGVFAIGLSLFVLEPTRKDEGWTRALALGAAYGLVIFGFANLRNALQITNWQFGISLIDAVWGTVLATATVALTRLAWEKIEEKKHDRTRRTKSTRSAPR